MRTTALLVASLLAANPNQQPAPPDDRAYANPASVERVRAALEQSLSKLTVPQRTADFTVNIRERDRFDRLVPSILDFQVGPGLPQSALFSASPFGSQPLVSVDLLSIAMATAIAVNKARHARAKRNAVTDVRRTIDAYCAAQPGGGAGIAVCARGK